MFSAVSSTEDKVCLREPAWEGLLLAQSCRFRAATIRPLSEL